MSKYRSSVMAFLVGGPLLMDILCGLHILYLILQTIELGIPPRFQCLVGVIWSAGYVVGARLAGHWCTPRRASLMLRVSVCTSAIFMCISFLIAPNFPLYLCLGLLTGVQVGFYFTPYQVKMGHIHPFRSMATAVAVYNISWGIGFALGYMGAGWVLDQPGTTWIVCGLVLVSVTAHLLLLGLVDRGGNSTERGVEEMTGDFASTAIQRRCALICMFVGFLFYTGLNGTLWPNLAKESGLSSTMVGIGACCAIIQIPALALLWAKLARRVRSPWLIIGMLFVVGLSGLSMPFVSGWPAHFLIMVCVGAGYSCLIYHGLFYANSDPVSRERSLGIVESTVGLGSLVGPTLMGVLAWDSGANRLPYVVGFCMVLVTCVVVAIMWRNATRASDG